jgi:subtilisin family serine protease
VLALSTATATPGVALPARSGVDPVRAAGDGLYVVTLAGQPSAAHGATRPAAGQRFDRTRPAVARHRQRLLARQDAVLAAVGGPEVLYRYTTALNGFAARLDERQVKRLRGRADVLLVERSTVRPTASDTVDFLDLDRRGGAWQRAGGPSNAGRGIVVGLVDTGVWPDSPSLAGLPQRLPGTARGLPGFHGACASAERWTPSDCNTKLVSARWFVRGFGEESLASSEHLSPRDAVGHGTHVASTAAGRRDVVVDIESQSFGRSSGMAPAARIAVYKACWSAPDPADDGCSTADAVAAVDAAVADGVDVLSYAAVGSDNPRDSLSRAFLGASAAGVFVAAAAGNNGPDPGTVGNAAPWVTTVAAGTSHVYEGSVRLPDGSSYDGAMTADRAVSETRALLAADAAAPGADPAAARRCEIGSLDAAAAQDAIVVCERGVNARVDKSTTVARAGGVGMVLANTGPDSVDGDVHAVPTVHLDADAAAAVTAYVRDAGADARLALEPAGGRDLSSPAVAPFSARGPVPGGDLLKPDLTAPGVAVPGAVAPPASSGRLWDLQSGTSVSTAHVAGLAALVRDVHPTWSPAEVKSAMTATAYDTADRSPFAQGAGHVDPSRFLDPGLVLDSRPAAWRGFLRGEVRPQDLNLPSVAVGGLVGRTTVARRVTNVSPTTETYTASVSGLAGVTARVRPVTFTLGPGESRRVRVRLVAGPSAPVDDFTRGTLTWTGLSHQVRMPVVVRTVDVSTPGEVGASGRTGSLEVTGRSGRGTPVLPVASGLVPANPVGLSLRPGAFDPSAPTVDDDTFATDVAVPTDTEALRVEVAGRNGGDDLDLYLYRGEALVDAATGASPDAVVTMQAPEAGDYRLLVHAARAGNGSTATAQLTTWVVGREGGSAMSVTPRRQATRPGGEFGYTVAWDDLDPTQRWLGVVRYAGTDRRTLVRVN